jgi:hypothetical protein
VAQNYKTIQASSGAIFVGGPPPNPCGIFNKVLEREMSAYRFVNGVLTPISNQAEVAEVEQAIEGSAACGMPGATEHLDTALHFLGKKPVPDYRNAIKEAISAVESVCSQIEGSKSSGFKAALKKLTEQIGIHPALQDAFVKLYGYTSDEEGVRHAILNNDVDVEFDEAKFMVVSCSAFVNYLIAKADAVGLIKG